MKILYVTNIIEASGGMERVLVQKANWLANNGYDVTILSLYGSAKPYFNCDKKIKIDTLNLDPVIVRGSIFILLSVLRKYRSDKMIASKVKSFISRNHFDVLFTQVHIPGIMKLKDGSLKVYESHMSKDVDNHVAKELNYNTIMRNVFKFRRYWSDLALRKYNYFVVLTEADRLLRGAPKNCVVIPNPITTKTPENRAKLENKEVISLGRLAYQKGYDYLIDAWKLVNVAHPDWKLKIYGSWQDCRGQYDKQIEDHNLLNVITIYDAVSDVNQVLLNSSIYVMSSRYEGFGLVLTEAMNCGVPCISYNCKYGPSTIITHNEDGLLVDNVGDVQGLAYAICKLIDNENMRKEYGQNAARNVMRFHEDAIMVYWTKIIQRKIYTNEKI